MIYLGRLIAAAMGACHSSRKPELRKSVVVDALQFIYQTIENIKNVQYFFKMVLGLKRLVAS